MPIVTVYPASYSAGSSPAWTTPENILLAEETPLYASVTPTYLGTTAILDVLFNPCSDIPDDGVINSIKIQICYKVSNTSAIVSANFYDAYDGATYGSQTTNVANTTNPIDVERNCNLSNWTVAKLKDGKAGAKLNAYRTNMFISSVVYFDYCRLVVDYSDPPPYNLSVNIGGTWKRGIAYVKIGDEWKSVVGISEKIGGVWK